MPEPLKGKVHWYEDGQPLLEFEDVKSALEWMIQEHEEQIEILIQELKQVNLQWKEWIIFDIEREYQSIMILEEGLSDVK